MKTSLWPLQSCPFKLDNGNRFLKSDMKGKQSGFRLSCIQNVRDIIWKSLFGEIEGGRRTLCLETPEAGTVVLGLQRLEKQKNTLKSLFSFFCCDC